MSSYYPHRKFGGFAAKNLLQDGGLHLDDDFPVAHWVSGLRNHQWFPALKNHGKALVDRRRLALAIAGRSAERAVSNRQFQLDWTIDRHEGSHVDIEIDADR